MSKPIYTFQAILLIIGVNPYLEIPAEILSSIFSDASQDKGPVPVCGKVNGREFRQTLVKYAGEWRFYINTSMLKDSPKRIGEVLDVEISFDPLSREIPMPTDFQLAMEANPEAKHIFEKLPPSLQKEIIRYIVKLKSEDSKMKNIDRAIQFLLGKQRFIGRDKP